MHKFLKKIFGGSEPVSKSMALDAIPPWLADHESAVKATLVSSTKEPMNAIRNATAQLQLIVNGISGAEHDPVLHPKLRTIAKNSLPQFVRAMNASLAKELPDDIEEFYTAAAECVKGCINSSHGQGRYLQAIFQEEMKDVRQGIDAIGHGINTINPLLATYRKEMTDIAAARSLCDAIVDLKTDYGKSGEKVGRAHARVVEITARQAEIEKELGTIPDDPRMEEISIHNDALKAITQKRDNAARTYSALSMTASHVLRKAEKIATRQHHPSEIAVLHHAMDLLSNHDIPDMTQMNDSLSAACPVAERMIADAEIVLKNKEERTVFSDTARFRSDISTAASSLRALEAEYLKAEKSLSTHPLVMKRESLEREKTQLAAMLVKENAMLAELDEWCLKTEKRIPDLMEELRKKIEGMMGDNVQFQVIDQTPL
ncbi:MAG: hypothetical protein M0R30_01310 [Methanoregula sp.]|uniref:hypothetical protein n=1 Tax=Methanoregula sp. TaxID=2052170 RepID=UPI0025D75FAE|nr:hypothetical protein [Methanoregula sp.]MCK9630253.1 hypothetical protein [Methanoregula sp.]